MKHFLIGAFIVFSIVIVAALVMGGIIYVGSNYLSEPAQIILSGAAIVTAGAGPALKDIGAAFVRWKNS